MSAPTADPDFLGADPAELEKLAAAMGSHADTLLRHRSVLGALLHEVPWIGEAADTFRREWATVHLRAFSDAIALLHATRDLLLHKAAAQREASAPTSGGLAIGTGGSRGVPLQGSDGAELQGSDGSVLQSGVAPALGTGIAAVGISVTRPTTAPPAHAVDATNKLPTIHNKETELAGYRAAYASHASYLHGFDEGQCTSWAIYRRHEMGLPLPPMNGHNNGGEMAANLGLSPGNQPHPGSLVSYGSGDGHVMVVESVATDGNTLHVSEMNFDSKGSLSIDSVLKRNPDGTWDKFLDGHLYRPNIVAQFSTA